MKIGDLASQIDYNSTGDWLVDILFYRTPCKSIRTQVDGSLFPVDDLHDHRWVQYRADWFALIATPPFDHFFDVHRGVAIRYRRWDEDNHIDRYGRHFKKSVARSEKNNFFEKDNTS